jgi:hypothetical protein
MSDETNRHWYVINYRTYPQGTRVQSLSLDELNQSKPLIARVGQTLLTPPNQAFESAVWLPPKRQHLERGETLTQTLTGSRAIRQLAVQVQASDLAQALRSTVLVAEFDGEQTVWCPVGDFFGSGVGLNAYRDWYRDVDRNGLLTSWWVMPFRESCRLALVNLDSQPVQATVGIIAHTPWKWDGRSLHFHAGWRQETGLRTKKAAGTMDWNFLEATGQGIYAGDTLAIHNGAGPWWGEGDEKIWVDGETFPSHFGTGTEDYYGYSYGDYGTFFESPFHSEPRWEGNGKPGFVTVTRTRSLDAIPFTKSLKFDMEIWHWSATRMTYAAATYWYARPGGRSNRGPQPEEALRSIDELRHRVPGVLEGEELDINSKSGGVTELQQDSRWSGSQHLWWRDAKPGDKLQLGLPVPKPGRYEIRMHLTRASDYGIVQFWLDGEKLGEPVDLYRAEVDTRLVTLGTRQLSGGHHILAAEVVGSNRAAKPRHMLGLDYVELRRAPR